MKLLSFELGVSFRSLPKGFKVIFQKNDSPMDLSTFRPYCLVGLNGCGKSNVLEALSQIFYHLELCVGIHMPQSLKNDKNIFNREECIIDAYKLEYLHFAPDQKVYNQKDITKVRIVKDEGEEPIMFVSSYMAGNDKFHKVSLLPSLSNRQSAEGKRYLPQYVVAYSSGENETLNIPYIKSRLLLLEEFKEATYNEYKDYASPENGMIYIDANMSQAILLCCLMFENEQALSNLRDYDYIGIVGIKRFQMVLREQKFLYRENEKETTSYFKVLSKDLFIKLKSCSTLSWHDEEKGIYYFDFYVNEGTKAAFRHYFHSAIECFQVFRLLYELNYYEISQEKEMEVLSSKGIHTDAKHSLPGPEKDAFHFLDFYLTKQIAQDGKTKDILLRSFSDGEHQFIHTMAICLLLKDCDSLILLDEPETHFNPNWRSQFIHILDNTLKNANNGTGYDTESSNMLKEVLITSHSPFIISDCLPQNVIILSKKENGKTVAQTAAEKGIKTYGASVGVLTTEIFDSNDTIGMRAYQEMKDISENEPDREKAIEEINSKFGESLEKLIVLSHLKQ